MAVWTLAAVVLLVAFVVAWLDVVVAYCCRDCWPYFDDIAAAAAVDSRDPDNHYSHPDDKDCSHFVVVVVVVMYADHDATYAAEDAVEQLLAAADNSFVPGAAAAAGNNFARPFCYLDSHCQLLDMLQLALDHYLPPPRIRRIVSYS